MKEGTSKWKDINKIKDIEDTNVHRSKELILLKWPYYQKQSTDSMQSLSNYPGHFSQN